MYQAIRTKYLGPTNSRKSRIKAIAAEGQTLTVDWDYALGVNANHTYAALKLANKLGWSGEWSGGSLDGDSYVFVLRGGLPTFVVADADDVAKVGAK